jgi:hypothetical protein
MGQTKHEKSFVNYDKTYETNIIGLRGIIYFTVGLFLLIVVSFGLMYVLQNAMETQAKETKDTQNPLMMNEQERLPPEPRLQTAPGFGVEGEQGRVNLELKAPQAEYRQLEDEWKKLETEGQKDPHTGMVVTLPVEEAKRKFLEENAKTSSGAVMNVEEGEKVLNQSRSIVSQSSSGRTSTDVRR